MGGIPVNLLALVKMMIKIIGKGKYELVPFTPDTKVIEIGDYIADYSKIKNTLGWKPKVGLEEGIRRTWAWLAQNA